MSLKRNLLLLSALSVFLFSCQPDHNVKPQSQIIGDWTLQQQHAVQIIDGVKKVDTVYNASAFAIANLTFKLDNTYSSASVYHPGNSLSSGPASSANYKGPYGLLGNTFNPTPSISGWYNNVVGSSTTPVSISNSVQITKLTASILTLHTENSFSVTYNSATHIYNVQSDFYYTK